MAAKPATNRMPTMPSPCVVELHTEMGVPLAKVAHLLRTTFGLAGHAGRSRPRAAPGRPRRAGLHGTVRAGPQRARGHAGREDCWHDDYDGAPHDGSAWTRGGDCGRRVLRGSSWGTQPRHSRSASRHSLASASYPGASFSWLPLARLPYCERLRRGRPSTEGSGRLVRWPPIRIPEDERTAGVQRRDGAASEAHARRMARSSCAP